MILGNSKKFKGTGYVCFIDVLGFSNDILKNWGNPKSNPLDKILAIKAEMPGFTRSVKIMGKKPIELMYVALTLSQTASLFALGTMTKLSSVILFLD